MVIDTLVQFASATALDTGGTGVANVGNVVDLSVVRDIGRGLPPIYLVILVTTTVTSGGSATVSFRLVTDSSASISTSTPVVHYASDAIAKATLVAGYELIVPVPLESPAYKRYLGFQQNVATAALTAGNVSAFLVLDPNAWKAYTSAVNA